MGFEKLIEQAKKKQELYNTSVYILKDNDGSFFSCIEMNLNIHLEKLVDKKIYFRFVKNE